MKNKIDYVQIIKDKIDIVDMLSRELNLIKAGDNYKALCPFHEEKTPSFTVNTKKQNYVCYGCGKNGDIFSYVMEKYKINFKEALEKLAKDANVKLDATLYNSSKGTYSNSKYYFKVMNDIALYYNSNLKKFLANNNISFLEKKKITDEKIEKYNLGLSDNSDKLEKFLAKMSVSLDYLIENNIFKINKFEKKFDLFTNRIMFPIKDRFENTIAFGGRTLSKEKPKYINSWENRFFKKRMTLYNLPSLNRIKKRSEEVYIVEGYTDVIAMESKGMKAIAPLGTSLSIDQFKLIWKFVNEPTLLMDGDEAGINASSRALDLVLPELQGENSLNFIFLKDGKDPDDIINNSNSDNSFFNLINNKHSFIETLIIFCGAEKQLNSPERIINFKNKIFEKIKFINDRDIRELYRSFILNRIKSISKKQINHFGNSFNSSRKDFYFTNLAKNKKAENFIIRRERSIVSAMLNNLKLLKQNDEILAKVQLSNPELEELRNKIIDIITTEKILRSDDLKYSLLDKGYEIMLKKHFQTKDCIKFDLVEEYAKESSDIKYATETLLNMIEIQDKWYQNKNKSL